jgi:hypothetical protein
VTEEKVQTTDKIAARGALLDFYSDRCVAFGGFFIAAIFGLLSVLALVQGINCNDNLLNFTIIGISVIVYGMLGYVGLFVLKGFGHYAAIADKLECSKENSGSLRDFASLQEIEFYNNDGTPNNLHNLLHTTYTKRQGSVAKYFLNSPIKLTLSYILLLLLLGIIAYVPVICRIF